MKKLILMLSFLGFFTFSAFAQLEDTNPERPDLPTNFGSNNPGSVSSDYEYISAGNTHDASATRPSILNLQNYDKAALSTLVGNDAISRLDIENGYKVTVYEDENFGGQSKVFVGPMGFNLKGDFWDNRISSLKVERN